MSRSPAEGLLVATVIAALYAMPSAISAAPPVRVPAAIDHAPWDALLKKYADERGLVDYAAWKKSESDAVALDQYLAQFAETGGPWAEGDAEIAALINACNAMTILWMLDSYPTPELPRDE